MKFIFYDSSHHNPKHLNGEISTSGKVFIRPISLYKKLPLGVKPDTSLAATKIARIPLKDCYKKRGLGIYLKAVSSHKNKIGVLLPLSGQTTSYSNETLIGIQRFFRRKNLNYDDYVVLEDTRDLPRQLESKLAKLIFVDAVAMIVGE